MTDISIGTLIGGCQILEEVGQGGMATVYRAHQISMNRDVAIKVLPPQFLHHSASLDRFKQEASIVARLEHRAIVPVHEYGEYEGIPYIVMRYMDGGSVDDLLAKGPVPPHRTLQILEQIAPALDYAHRENVLHRDLKPSNILLDTNGDAYLTDFGIARILSSNAKPLTTSGVVGTPSYMSPEQAQGHDLDDRSYLYALGVVLFEMLTGVRPFEGETPYSVAVKHVTEAPPSACDINPDLSHSSEAVLFKALEKKRELRYETAGELAGALKQAIEQQLRASDSVSLTQTEPSLTEKLKAEEARRRTVSKRIPPQQPALPPISAADVRQPPPNIQVMPRYVPAASRSYASPLVRPRRRQRGSGRSSWMTWTAIALLVGGLLLAAVVGGGYYLMNDGSLPASRQADYSATAVFKLTATKQAILQSLDQPAGSQTPSQSEPVLTSTLVPTNTLR
ncbi:MAG TPA: serine/threonine-protein kinase, partial [Aggregatilineaceae bacterium]|nr:serine/threonine-protein kinase [Aggregatilineaceae bacterium]